MVCLEWGACGTMLFAHLCNVGSRSWKLGFRIDLLSINTQHNPKITTPPNKDFMNFALVVVNIACMNAPIFFKTSNINLTTFSTICESCINKSTNHVMTTMPLVAISNHHQLKF